MENKPKTGQEEARLYIGHGEYIACQVVEASIGRSSEAASGPLLFISFEYPCDVSQYVHDIFTSEFTTSYMLKRRPSVSNCCRIESSNRLNSIFIKFNFFIFLNTFVRGARTPGALPLDPPLAYCAVHEQNEDRCLSSCNHWRPGDCRKGNNCASEFWLYFTRFLVI